MNIGITTSFFVGGLLLVSILHMNFSVSNNASETTLQMMTKAKMTAITEILSSDFNRMAHSVPNSNQVIDNASGSAKIIFQADLDDDGTPNTITWEFKTGEDYSGTVNPNDKKLVRIVPVSEGGSGTPEEFPAVDFNLTYYDENNIITTDYQDVKQIEVELLFETAEAVSKNTSKDSETYGRSYWHKRLVPPSLQFHEN